MKAKELKKGDLVLRNAQLTGIGQEKGKLSANWEGPYIIKEIVKEGTFILMDSSGKTLPWTWHSNSLRKYYA